MGNIIKYFKVDKTQYNRKCDYQLAVLRKISRSVVLTTCILVSIAIICLPLYFIGVGLFTGDFSLIVGAEKMTNIEKFIYSVNMLAIIAISSFIGFILILKSYSNKNKFIFNKESNKRIIIEFLIACIASLYTLMVVLNANLLYEQMIALPLCLLSLGLVSLIVPSLFSSIGRMMRYKYIRAKRKYCKVHKGGTW
jgi:hypothetical protein